ncbi:MAG: hypothetical protein IJ594_05865 [Oscillospiraceae bacterium]|nr:hypothetical protein [Oscillospiraceae bacterium]
MSFADLIASSRGYLSRFDYDNYPPCFSAFEADGASLFAALEGADPEQAAAVLIDELERRRGELPRRAQKQQAEEEKRVLALFLSPAALRYGGAAADFAGALSRQWNARYPRNTFLPGDYDVIMKGFDSNLLGLPLRKSKKR